MKLFKNSKDLVIKGKVMITMTKVSPVLAFAITNKHFAVWLYINFFKLGNYRLRFSIMSHTIIFYIICILT